MEVKELPIDQIDQPRMLPRWGIDGPGLQELAESIRTHGLIQPIAVVRAGERYRLVAGNRRLHACRDLLGWDTIPAVVHEGLDSEEGATAVENLQRLDLDPVEQALMFAQLIQDRGMTQDEVAALVGKQRTFVAKRLMLLDLDELTLAAVVNGEISWTHALELRRIEDPDRRLYYLDLAKHHGVNVRILRGWVDEELRRPTTDTPPPTFDYESTQVQAPPLEPMRCTLCGASERERILVFIPVCQQDRDELVRIVSGEEMQP